MPLTVGTAGHVDHGKTWLVRALTGKDTDRLREERARGISIDLGYAPLDLPDGRRLSLVDVPGHERFVRTMVAGATGIDLFLLVIDAAEGARPQTHEHLAILRLLGVERGVVAVTKADAVDAETLELALEEARELVPGADAVAVSAKMRLGLDELRAALARAAVASQPPGARDAPTRLHVDRVFTLRGIGTVATGTLWSGTIGEGDVLRAEPAACDVRVRSVQVHDRPVARAEAGQRVAVALRGLDRRRLRRGDVLCEPGAFAPSYRLDVALEELTPIAAAATVHHGTAHAPARVIRRADGTAQLRLAEPVVAARGDRFVLRAGTTIGGGVVVDPAPPRSARAAPPPAPPAAAPPSRPPASPPVAAVDRVRTELAAAGRASIRVDDAALARLLEEQGVLVRLGKELAVARATYELARAAAVAACDEDGAVTLARFRDRIGSGRRDAQLLLERLDSDGITRRVGDERVLRRGARGR